MPDDKSQKGQKKPDPPKLGRKGKTFKEVKDALWKCFGIRDAAAETLGVNYFSLDRMFRKWPKLREIQNLARERRKDRYIMAYDGMVDGKEKDPQTIRHAVETFCKDRGYGKAAAVQINPPDPVNPGEMTSEQIARKKAEIEARLAQIGRRRDQVDRRRKEALPGVAELRPGGKGKARATKQPPSVHPSDDAGIHPGVASPGDGGRNSGNGRRGPKKPPSPDAPKAREKRTNLD